MTCSNLLTPPAPMTTISNVFATWFGQSIRVSWSQTTTAPVNLVIPGYSPQYISNPVAGTNNYIFSIGIGDPTITTTVYVTDASTGIGGQYTVAPAPVTLTIGSTVNSSWAGDATTSTTVNIDWTQNINGSVRIKVDGISVQTVTGVSGTNYATLTNVSRAAHNICVEPA